LGVGVGQSVRVEVLEGEQPVRTAIVQGVAKEFAGMGAYMDRTGMNRWMHESDVVSGSYLAVDSRHQNELYRELKRTPRVAAVLVKSATVTQFRETIAENQKMMQSFTAFFAIVIAVGVVYSTARISVEERARELATLRVIGFTNYEVATILLGELAVITIVAVPIGWLIGYGFTLSMVRGFESELFRLPLVVRVETYAWAACVVGAASAVSGLIVQRRISRFDLVDVLKSHE
jgi:putative ABC transport system permease protein